MELTRRSLISLFATGALASVAPISAFADETAETEEGSVITAPAGSEEAAAQLIDAIQGDYVELFPVLRQYPDIWHEQCAAIVGEDDADDTAEMLQASMEGTLRGEEAARAYEADPDSMAFDCSFPDGIATLHFDGTTVTGTAQDGTEVFSHEYEYLCYSPVVDFYVFRTADEDAGEYRYFVSRSDNPTDTFHLEMRFGSDLNDLFDFFTGAYAYTMPAAIPADASNELIEQCIALFVTENLEG